jgi:hypothetical protein
MGCSTNAAELALNTAFAIGVVILVDAQARASASC